MVGEKGGWESGERKARVFFVSADPRPAPPSPLQSVTLTARILDATDVAKDCVRVGEEWCGGREKKR
jgi:hypothetical protein